MKSDNGTFIEVKARRARLVRGWVTTRKEGAVNLGPFVGVHLNL